MFRKPLLLLPLLIASLAFFPGSFGVSRVPVSVELKKGASGNAYTLIYQNSSFISFETSRPDKTDTSIYLCIAAAFTRLDDFSIDGLYICKGKTGNINSVNHTIGGAVKIINGQCSIFPTAKGKALTDSLIRAIENKKGSLFQQIQMIENGSAATFKDVQLFQRRGIVIFKDGRTAIAESVRAITLKTFANDLVGLGAKDLLYTDMGSWDEGWYRNNEGQLKILGNNRSQTSKQSNWIVFRK
jgi:hypothetical protein